MNKKNISCLIIGFILCSSLNAQPMQTDESVSSPQTSSRYLAVKTNLAAWAGMIMNLAADVQVSEHFSVELPVLWCPWYVGEQTRRKDVYHPARSPLLAIEARRGAFPRRSCTRGPVQREVEPRPLSGHRPSASRRRYQLRLPAAL